MREGRWMGKAPIGYTNVKETKSIVINPDSSKYVIQAYEMMATGMYYAEEVRRIIRDQGFYFTKQKFLNILRNRFYCGIIEIKPWRNQPALSLKGLHDPWSVRIYSIGYNIHSICIKNRGVKAKYADRNSHYELCWCAHDADGF